MVIRVTGLISRVSSGPGPLVLWLALLVIGSGWGSTYYLSKQVMAAGHHPLGISLAVTFIGALLVTGVLMLRGGGLPYQPRHLLFYTVCGILGITLPNALSYAAVLHLPVGIMAIVIATVPMMTLFGAALLRIERPDRRRLTGILLGAAAVALIMLPEQSLPSRTQVLWIILPLITAASYSAENLYLATRCPPECDPLHTICGLSLAATIMLGGLVLASDTGISMSGLVESAAYLVPLSVANVLSYLGFLWLIARAGPVFAAQTGYVVTVSGVLWGIVLLGETHAVTVWLALLVMLAGLMLVRPRT